MGIPVIDTDEIARSLTQIGEPALESIRRTFGGSFFHPDGALNRPLLRQRIFSNSEDKRRLEKILHPLIRQEAVRQLACLTSDYAIIAIPLLLETGAYNKLIQRILLIDCTEQQQVERVMKRSALSEAEVKAVLSNQIDRQNRIRAADEIIVNDGALGAFELKIRETHQVYQKLAALKPA